MSTSQSKSHCYSHNDSILHTYDDNKEDEIITFCTNSTSSTTTTAQVNHIIKQTNENEQITPTINVKRAYKLISSQHGYDDNDDDDDIVDENEVEWNSQETLGSELLFSQLSQSSLNTNNNDTLIDFQPSAVVKQLKQLSSAIVSPQQFTTCKASIISFPENAPPRQPPKILNTIPKQDIVAPIQSSCSNAKLNQTTNTQKHNIPIKNFTKTLIDSFVSNTAVKEKTQQNNDTTNRKEADVEYDMKEDDAQENSQDLLETQPLFSQSTLLSQDLIDFHSSLHQRCDKTKPLSSTTTTFAITDDSNDSKNYNESHTSSFNHHSSAYPLQKTTTTKLPNNINDPSCNDGCNSRSSSSSTTSTTAIINSEFPKDVSKNIQNEVKSIHTPTTNPVAVEPFTTTSTLTSKAITDDKNDEEEDDDDDDKTIVVQLDEEEREIQMSLDVTNEDWINTDSQQTLQQIKKLLSCSQQSAITNIPEQQLLHDFREFYSPSKNSDDVSGGGICARGIIQKNSNTSNKIKEILKKSCSINSTLSVSSSPSARSKITALLSTPPPTNDNNKARNYRGMEDNTNTTTTKSTSSSCRIQSKTNGANTVNRSNQNCFSTILITSAEETKHNQKHELQKEIEDEFEMHSQRMLGSEDQVIKDMERSGEMTQVFGSQSILTQEIMDMNASPLAGVKLKQMNTISTMEKMGMDQKEPVCNSDTGNGGGSSSHINGSYPYLVQRRKRPISYVDEKAKSNFCDDAKKVKKETKLKPHSLTRNPYGILFEAAQILENRNEGTTDKYAPKIRSNSQNLLCEESIENFKTQTQAKVSTESSLLSSPSSLSLTAKRTTPTSTSSPKQKPINRKMTTTNKNLQEPQNPIVHLEQSPEKQNKKPKRPSRPRAPPSSSVLSTAQKAASLSRSILNNPLTSKQLLLRMALVRENPRHPRTDPPRGALISHGFFWGNYPSLENVLRKHMKEYYDLSTNKRQSRAQQEFNNKLVTLVKKEAAIKGWEFDKTEFDNDRKIRDRIRCFFKTHIQNSKKRLRTMLKNPTKRANAKALVKHMDLMDEDSTSLKIIESPGFREKEQKERKEIGTKENNKIMNRDKNNTEEDNDSNNLEPEEEDVEQYAQDANTLEIHDVDETTHDAALALGFMHLSQDSQIRLHL